MSRPHTLVEFRLVEYQLARAMLALTKRKNQVDYKLDIEFQNQLEALMGEFNYSAEQVISLLMARDRFTQRDFNPLLDLLTKYSNEDVAKKIETELGREENARQEVTSRVRSIVSA